MRALSRVETESSDPESFQPKSFSYTRKTLAVGAVLLGVVGVASLRFNNQCINLGALQGKSEVDIDAEILKTANKLKNVKNRTLADAAVMKAMARAGHEVQKEWEADSEHHIRRLPDVVATVNAINEFNQGEKNTIAGHMECSFNVLEAFVSVVGMGDDINGMIRTCPPPRDGESELACQVDSSILVAWVGNIAAKLSLACSNCALTANVDAVCTAGVSGLVAAFGEIAAGGCLAAATCTGTPPVLTTTKISELGDQTIRGRRLLIGQGTVGNGVQCGVDVGMVAANIANMGIAINKAVHINNCGKFSTMKTPLNVLKGIPDAFCTVDIAGAVAYVSQVVTFIQLIVVHCQDFLDVSALCGGSIAAITTGAAAIAAYSGALHAGCRYNKLLKNSDAVNKINELWNTPSLPRRLDEKATLEGVEVNVDVAPEPPQEQAFADMRRASSSRALVKEKERHAVAPQELPTEARQAREAPGYEDLAAENRQLRREVHRLSMELEKYQSWYAKLTSSYYNGNGYLK